MKAKNERKTSAENAFDTISSRFITPSYKQRPPFPSAKFHFDVNFSTENPSGKLIPFSMKSKIFLIFISLSSLAAHPSFFFSMEGFVRRDPIHTLQESLLYGLLKLEIVFMNRASEGKAFYRRRKSQVFQDEKGAKKMQRGGERNSFPSRICRKAFIFKF